MKLIYTFCFVLCSMFAIAQNSNTHYALNTSSAINNSVEKAFSDFSLIYATSFVQLDWLINDGNPAAYCVVEKSVDGKNWKDIGIAFSGEESANEYKYLDTKVEQVPVLLYRIRKVSSNGTVTLSQTKEFYNTAIARNASSQINNVQAGTY